MGPGANRTVRVIYWENKCLSCLLFLLLVRLRVVGITGSSSKRLKLPEKDDL